MNVSSLLIALFNNRACLEILPDGEGKKTDFTPTKFCCRLAFPNARRHCEGCVDKHYLVAVCWAGCDLPCPRLKNNTGKGKKKKGACPLHLSQRVNRGQVCLFGYGTAMYPKVENTRCGSGFSNTKPVMMLASISQAVFPFQTSLHSTLLFTASFLICPILDFARSEMHFISYHHLRTILKKMSTASQCGCGKI